jgi:hypothetical protein
VSDAKWRLKPSIMRGVRSEAENQIFSELMLEGPTECSNDKAMFDELVRAQHYGSTGLPHIHTSDRSVGKQTQTIWVCGRFSESRY